MPILNIELSEYDALRNRVNELEAENNRLREERDRICEENKVRVINREYHFEHGRTCGLTAVTKVKDKLVNFDDIKESVEKSFKDKIYDEMKSKILGEFTKLQKECSEAKREADTLKAKAERLMKRGLWDRIRNKEVE